MRAKNLLESFYFAFQGIAYSLRTQRNFRLHCLIALAVLALLAVLEFSLPETIMLLSAVFAVLICELFNTAVEKTIDLVTRDVHPLAMIAKNCAAAAVLLAALYAVSVGTLLILPKLLRLM